MALPTLFRMLLGLTFGFMGEDKEKFKLTFKQKEFVLKYKYRCIEICD